MRASSLLLLTLIFTAAEYPLHIFGVNGKCKNPGLGDNYGEIPANLTYAQNSKFRMPCKEGYLRKAGTSNLFKCQQNNSIYLWWNFPPLRCIVDPRIKQSTTVANTQTHTTSPNLAFSTPSTAEKPYFTTTGKPVDTSTGQTAFTTTHTVATTTGTSHHTTLRTTTKEEESMTTTSSVTISSSSTLTDRENLTTVSSKFTSSSNISTTSTTTNTRTTISTTTSTGPSGNKFLSIASTGGIAAGTVLMLIVIAGSAAGILIWCRRQDVSSTTVEMTQALDLDPQPLLDPGSSPNSQNLKTDPLVVVQQA